MERGRKLAVHIETWWIGASVKPPSPDPTRAGVARRDRHTLALADIPLMMSLRSSLAQAITGARSGGNASMTAWRWTVPTGPRH